TAAFYSFFHLRPRGEYCLLWSDNIIDRMAGSRTLMQRLCEALWLEPGRLSEDGLAFVHTTSDIGMGDQAPALLVNYRVVTRMTAERVDAMAELIRNRVPLVDWPRDWFRVEDDLRRTGPLLGESLTPGEALRAALARGAETQLAEIAASGLRGRGGAGFPTARKWQACRDASLAADQTRIVVCNADEGEPGTFKDRVLLSSYADLVFEGMTIAAFTVGARRGFLYLRGEYRYLLDALEAVLQRRRDQGLLGSDILGTPGFDFDIEIHLGAGAYVCGEESALLESLEGKPGRPRLRPPFPVTHGHLGQPTVVNNVETFACAARIAEKGAAWFAALGTPRSTGSKLISISGDVARPGVYEFPFGVTVAEALEAAGVRNCVQGVQVSGPSGTTLTGEELGRRLCFEDLPTAGALMVFDCTRDMFDVAHNFAHFFAHESCGFCTPCRVGTQIIARLMDKIAAGRGSQYDLQELPRLHRLLQETAHCGLGHSAGNPVIATLTKFRPAYERRLKSLEFAPAFDLDAELSQARQMTGRDDAGAHLVEV
ncbi:MAG: NADH-ubiquinone oxidoreductase-F iron-sulfur binding region domain-containing protein, partial [Rhodocyclaceae bacterium]